MSMIVPLRYKSYFTLLYVKEILSTYFLTIDIVVSYRLLDGLKYIIIVIIKFKNDYSIKFKFKNDYSIIEPKFKNNY